MDGWTGEPRRPGRDGVPPEAAAGGGEAARRRDDGPAPGASGASPPHPRGEPIPDEMIETALDSGYGTVINGAACWFRWAELVEAELVGDDVIAVAAGRVAEAERGADPVPSRAAHRRTPASG